MKLLVEKTLILNSSKTHKLELDSKGNELKKVINWLENLQKLEAANIKYIQEFEQVTLEKENKKEDFIRLDFANKALNVQPIYQEKNSLTQIINQDKEKLEKLQKELEDLKQLLESTTNESLKSKDELDKEKISFDTNSKKLQEVRTLQTQINSKVDTQKEKNRKILNQKQELATLFKIDFQDMIEDEELISQNYIAQKNKIKNIESDLETILGEFTKIEEKTLNLNEQENNLRKELKLTEELLKNIEQYEKLSINIQNEKKLIDELEQQIKSQNSINIEKVKLITQIEENLQILKDKKEKELLIKNYEEDRKKLQSGKECFLCGSKEHPYITHSLNIDINITTIKLKEQEDLKDKESNELKQSEINIAKFTSKIESSNLEIQKLEAQQTANQEFFVSCNFQIKEDSKTTLQEQRISCEQELNELIELRDEKDKISRQKELIQANLNQKIQEQIKTDNLINTMNEIKNELVILNQDIQTLQIKSKAILDVVDLNIFEKEITSKFNIINEKYNSLSKELVNLNSKNESLNTQIIELNQKQINYNTKLEETKQNFTKALVENSFTSKEEFEKALLSKELREELNLMCKELDEKYNQIQTLKNDTIKKLQEQKELNLTDKELQTLNDESKELQTVIDELQKSIGSLEKELEINASNMKKHEDKINDLEKKKKPLKYG